METVKKTNEMNKLIKEDDKATKAINRNIQNQNNKHIGHKTHEKRPHNVQVQNIHQPDKGLS